MTNKYHPKNKKKLRKDAHERYQKHKERLQKEACKKYKNLSGKENSKMQKTV